MSYVEDDGAKAALGPNALLDCDVVMAGGVTSGIIYPGAIAVIARRYSFHSIGGTSVGAIAAAVTAAAEYGRRTGRNLNAFAGIHALAKSLGEQAHDGRSRLFHLFTPEETTKPLLALVTPIFGAGGPLRQIAGFLRFTLSAWQIASPVAIAMLAGIILVGALVFGGHLILSVIALIAAVSLVLAVWLGMLVFVLQRHWLRAWRVNGYGICTGNMAPEFSKQADHAAFEGLTPWMHRVVQAAAGLELDDPPVTFGNLWNAPTSAGSSTTVEDPTAPRAIDLAMIASDISRNRMVQLPFLETPSPIYVETAILDQYFPPCIATWMKERAGVYDERIEKREDVIRLPKPQDLPIVFGARVSLSFPVLLSALPLMTPDFAKGRSANGCVPLRRVWFSDGGLTSNFPVYFFDSPIPSRPTFCLNLVDFDAEAPEVETSEIAVDQDGARGKANANSGSDARKAIAEPRAAERTAENRPKLTPSGDPHPGDKVWNLISMNKGNRFSPASFTAFDTAPGAGIVSFLKTLLNTARFCRDNQMLIAPGVRDRVVNIALRDDEGGLNLDMDSRMIADLDLRGRAAGLLIAARFDPKAKRDPETGEANTEIFANHRWVRFRNFMAAFEDLTRRFATSRRKSDAAAEVRNESLLDTMIAGRAEEKLGYPAPSGARSFYRTFTDEFEQLALKMAAATRSDPEATFDRPRSFASGQKSISTGAAPRPKMRTPLQPLVNNDPRAEQADLPGPSMHP
jgi:predicted acylesterase/phospholipase RssA